MPKVQIDTTHLIRLIRYNSWDRKQRTHRLARPPQIRNTKAAQKIGVVLPQTLPVSADEVIE
jgi:hypothetical protein